MSRAIRNACLTLAACVALACAAPRAVETSSGDNARAYPSLDVLPVDFAGVQKGLVRGIVGAPEEMLDTAVRNAGSFDAGEARGLRSALRSEAHGAGFGNAEKSKPLSLHVRVLTHLARVGEIWPVAEYLVEAEYSITGPGFKDGVPRGVYMYYSAWFYWSMESLRGDVMKSLAGNIIRDIARNLDGVSGVNREIRGRAKFYDNAGEAREEFFGE